MPVASTILRRVNRRGRGAVFTAQDFVDLGSRNAVDQALTRLASSGQIRRVKSRGVRLATDASEDGADVYPADAVAQAVAKQTDSQLQVSGASAANALGLSTQVPAKVEYLTDGPSRSIHIGKLVVCLKHAGRVDMLLPKTRAGMAIVALRHMGRNAASEAVLQSLAAKLKRRTSRSYLRYALAYPDGLVPRSTK